MASPRSERGTGDRMRGAVLKTKSRTHRTRAARTACGYTVRTHSKFDSRNALRYSSRVCSVEVAVGGDLLDLRKLPLAVAQRAHGARLEPPRDTVEMEDVAAATPGDAVARIVGYPRVCEARWHARRG